MTGLTKSAQAIFETAGGVEMQSPPAVYLEDTTQMISDAVAHLGPNDRGILTWVASTAGVNLALVNKINGHVDVAAWVGKSWNAPLEAGIVGRVHW